MIKFTFLLSNLAVFPKRDMTDQEKPEKGTLEKTCAHLSGVSTT